MKLLLIIGSAVAAVGLFLLATASSDTTFFAHNPFAARRERGARSSARRRGGLSTGGHGAPLPRARFWHAAHPAPLLRFAALAVLPGLIVYTVSVQFITRSIESWFDVKVDAALEGGINLGQQAIDQMLVELQTKARAMALDLADTRGSQLVPQLDRLRLQAGAQEALVLAANGRLQASASEECRSWFRNCQRQRYCAPRDCSAAIPR